jgi:hypothetical protein
MLQRILYNIMQFILYGSYTICLILYGLKLYISDDGNRQYLTKDDLPSISGLDSTNKHGLPFNLPNEKELEKDNNENINTSNNLHPLIHNQIYTRKNRLCFKFLRLTDIILSIAIFSPLVSIFWYQVIFQIQQIYYSDTLNVKMI